MKMNDKPKALIFGAGATGKALLPMVRRKYEVIGYLDNDPIKWKKKSAEDIDNLPVHNPQMVFELAWDSVVIGTYVGLDPMTEQLVDMGIDRSKIDQSYISLAVNARVIFLENLSEMYEDIHPCASVAEGGVFQGDFAKEISRVFPNRKLYLFDTFSGFDERDVVFDKERNFSELGIGHFNITSEELVMSKLPHPEMAVIRKGYFPESTKGIEDQFCFVNLDFDLYQPILAGLAFFYPRMIKGGVILVHEYFSDSYRGVKEAVDGFSKKNGLNLFPIGDGLSIGILC